MNMTTNTPSRHCLVACFLMSLAFAGGALAANVINVNYGRGAGAFMQGVWSHDSAASGKASRPAPLAYLGNTWNDFSSPTAVGSNLLDSVGKPTGIGLATTMEGGLWDAWATGKPFMHGDKWAVVPACRRGCCGRWIEYSCRRLCRWRDIP